MTTAPMKLIRKTILDISQEQMAEITNASQATVSRWETGELEPDRKQMDLIRAAALARDIPWKDEYFFNAAAIPQERAA
jgi:DNA-binding transcriptional regulator YiaG